MIEENTIPKISRIEVDRDLCIGAESCVILAGKTFKMDDERKAIIIDPKGDNNDMIYRAAQACPVAAVFLYDEDNKQIYP